MRAVAYHKETKVLFVFFHSGSIWAYNDVPQENYFELLTSKSIGNYFNKNIRNVFESEKVFSAEDNNRYVEA